MPSISWLREAAISAAASEIAYSVYGSSLTLVPFDVVRCRW